jgi:hypothetical protein
MLATTWSNMIQRLVDETILATTPLASMSFWPCPMIRYVMSQDCHDND